MHWLAKQNTPVVDIDRNLEAFRSPAKVSEHYHKIAARAWGVALTLRGRELSLAVVTRILHA